MPLRVHVRRAVKPRQSPPASGVVMRQQALQRGQRHARFRDIESSRRSQSAATTTPELLRCYRQPRSSRLTSSMMHRPAPRCISPMPRSMFRSSISKSPPRQRHQGVADGDRVPDFTAIPRTVRPVRRGFRFPSSRFQNQQHIAFANRSPRWHRPRYCPPAASVTGVPAPAGAGCGWRGGRNGCGQLLISPPSLTFTTKALPSTSDGVDTGSGRLRFCHRLRGFCLQKFKRRRVVRFSRNLRPICGNEQRHGEHVVNGVSRKLNALPAPGA